ncbi:hypothetical protein N8K70_07770 [Microbacterium betulae]|uniref:Uncharacterized protein n=1 Tax=Microbacterium betulae TaxID=2981139 RepID=A0AA97FJB1_9MICO|nr:hypothetical protein [Microbacterium sp. AB]WOF24546.1 hypothetical protein N8K70_07770 [Microbacterium sp. AB]
MPSRSSTSASRTVSFEAAVRDVVALVAERAADRLVIDGRSGAGKTTLARRVAAEWPSTGAPQVVSLDELYPGWGGLREGGALARALVLEPHHRGEAGAYRRFDWARGTFAGPLVVVDPSLPLVVEGCGALAETVAELADASLWMDGPEAQRRRRALVRDGGGFERHWSMWADQEDAHIARERPDRLAQLALSVI